MEKTIAEEMLISKNIAPTPMRILTLEFLQTQEFAVSLSDIEDHFIHSDRVTLYRTLKTFEKKGLIHSIQENNATKYSLCDEACEEDFHKDNHLHFYCTQCKETVCLPEVDLSKIQFPSTFKIQQLRFFSLGICDKCLIKTMQ